MNGCVSPNVHPDDLSRVFPTSHPMTEAGQIGWMEFVSVFTHSSGPAADWLPEAPEHFPTACGSFDLLAVVSLTTNKIIKMN